MRGSVFTFLLGVYLIIGVYLYEWFHPADEIFSIFIALYACLKMSLGLIPRNKALIIWLCIDFGYLVYSLTINSNVKIAIFNDFIMQSKPYLTFFGLMCLKPRLTGRNLTAISILCIFCALLIPIINFFYPHIDGDQIYNGKLLCGATLGSAATLTGVLFYLTAPNDNLSTKFIAISIILLGLLAPTSKYIAMLIFTCIIIFFIKKPVKINIKTFVAISFLSLSVIYVIWDDFKFYFINGIEEEIARAVLYQKMPDVLNDYIPFGSGFATYANAASATWYSPLYYKYNLDEIWGLGEDNAHFVSDTYYPTLAQFGYAGIFLFVLFITYIFRHIKTAYLHNSDLKRYKVALMIVLYILIESTTDASILQARGVLAMIILSMSLYQYCPRPHIYHS